MPSATIRVGVDGHGARSGSGQGAGDGIDGQGAGGGCGCQAPPLASASTAMELAAVAVSMAMGTAYRVGVAVGVKDGTCAAAAAAFHLVSCLLSRLPLVVRGPAHPPVPCGGGDGGYFPPDHLCGVGVGGRSRGAGAGAFQPNPPLTRPVANPTAAGTIRLLQQSAMVPPHHL
ncbi:hypothetical protein OsI_22318 [Oryza sativa Indica Group]|uniref:Uncharacterized protein n=1 Tax=Oryza sativa subsp. indica TaxID=39946 RepID=A2YB41_ORYSI|nr:hypothetical protein OsI_22318 [Oryza sativa Indica Group]